MAPSNNTIKEYKFKDGLPLEFEILDICNLFVKHKGMLTTPHRANFYHIIWVKEGHCTHLVDFNPIDVEAGSILFVPKNCINTFDPKPIFSGKLILFTDSFFCRDSSDSVYLQSTSLFSIKYGTTQLKIESNGELDHYLLSMEREQSRPLDNVKRDILQNLLHNFLLIAKREKKSQGLEETVACDILDLANRFKQQLEERFKIDKAVSIYAEKLNTSEKRLTKATLSVTGKTPKVLIDERVMLEAKRLLVYSQSSIKEIAFNLGFEEATYFIKFFKRYSHKTPIEFREEARKAYLP